MKYHVFVKYVLGNFVINCLISFSLQISNRLKVATWLTVKSKFARKTLTAYNNYEKLY